MTELTIIGLLIHVYIILWEELFLFTKWGKSLFEQCG